MFFRASARAVARGLQTTVSGFAGTRPPSRARASTRDASRAFPPAYDRPESLGMLRVGKVDSRSLTRPLSGGLRMKADQSQFVRTIEIKDRSGRVVGTKEVVTYQG